MEAVTQIRLTASLMLAAGSMAAAPAPIAVTTDSAAYCVALEKRLPPPPDDTPEISRLRAEGRMMCARGHVRGGIIRLRRALMLARGTMEDPP